MYGIPLTSDPALARAVAGLPHPATVSARHPSSRPSPRSPGRWAARLRPRRRRRGPDIAPLLQIPSLAHADPRQLVRMVPHTSSLRLPPGRALVKAGETARELIVILSGEAITEGPGDRLVVLGPGAEIGGREALRHERHAATVVATTPLDVVVVDGPSLRWAHAEGVARLGPATPATPAAPEPRRAPVRPVTAVAPKSRVAPAVPEGRVA